MKTRFATLAIWLVSCVLASASTLTLNCTPAISPLEFFSDSFDVGPNCPTFTLAGATAETVQITLNVSVSGTVNLFNDGTGDLPNALAIEVTKVFFQEEGEDSAFAMSHPLTLTIQTAPQTIGPGVTSLTETSSGSLSGPDVILNSPFLQFYYVGLGFQAPVGDPYDVFLGFDISSQSSIVATMGATFFPNTIEVSPVITYTYSSASDVPEPSTLLTLGAGLLGMVIAAFKRPDCRNSTRSALDRFHQA